MNMQALVPALIVALLVASGCKPSESAQESTATQEVKVQDVARDYARLIAMTPKPVFVNPELAMLCRGASQKEVEAAAKTLGPHAHTSVRIFMNDQAAEAFKQKAQMYPVGSVVVKEKQGLHYWAKGEGYKGTKTHSGVGGMIKRAKGYDPDHGDWEYFYFEDPARIESGKIASCVQCHAGAAEKDYIFGNWAKAPE
jgi:hypothetical protein